MPCKHEHARKVVTGAPAKWCPHCGYVFDGVRWHRHATTAPTHKQHPAKKHTKGAKHKKARSPAQKAATARMLAARAHRGHAAR